MATELAMATIGVLTALPKECAAVETVFGPVAAKAAAGDGGGRSYTVARIPSTFGGEHVVAIALLPDTGNCSAAARAAKLLEHCPHVRHLIMVGIAGAVPHPNKPEHHVRLGDIVVSDRHGVVQYRFVKIDGETEELRSPPRAPGAALTDAVRLLQKYEVANQRPWEAHIAPAVASIGSCARRPPAKTDQLHEWNAGWPVTDHPKDLRRKNGMPRVFLGPIASADVLLKQPALRDRLRDRHGVKAIEMEGAGIADASWLDVAGYLVIRGTCDYCNKDKGDAWQLYASVVAAAYARSVIEHMPVESNGPRPDVRSSASNWLVIPERQWTGAPSALLRADHAIVPFHRRSQELADLERWTLSDDAGGVRLLIGSGGMGKTRLVRELCLLLRSQSVPCGFVDPTQFAACAAYLNAQSDEPMLLAVDYAESAESGVASILRIVSKRRLTRLRLVLIARGAGYWWSRLKRMGDGVGELLCRDPERLRPLATDVDARRESYDRAGRAFAAKLKRPDSLPEPPHLGGSHYERALLLHMSALLAVQGVSSQGMDPILDTVLGREAAYWARRLRDCQVPQFLERGFERAMGIISARGGVRDKMEAVDVIGRIRFFHGQPRAVVEAVADTLHDCYPGPPWIEPIQPDLLMEYLVAKATKDGLDDFERIVLTDRE